MIVLDASAILAVLKAEDGAESVVELMRGGAIVSAANLAEVLSKSYRMGRNPKDVAAQLREMSISTRASTAQHALRVAELQPYAQGCDLSYADRFCIALAEEEKATLVTADAGIASTPNEATVFKFR